MKKLIYIFLLAISTGYWSAQELLANVQVNYSQIGGSMPQLYKNMEKNLRDFINNTSWTGRKLQNFEKIKSNFAIVITSKEGSNKYNASIVVQAVRPVFGTTYETPLININDTNFSFEYNENENLIFNERQYSGKNLTDVLAFYIYVILGYDADSFKSMGGQPWFERAQKISRNAMNQRFGGWSPVEGPRTRGKFIDTMMNPESATMRSAYYNYHRNGLDNLHNANRGSAKRAVADAIMQLQTYENDFQLNYPFNVFIDTKKDEILNIFSNGNNASVNMSALVNLLNTLSPKDSDTKWSRLK